MFTWVLSWFVCVTDWSWFLWWNLMLQHAQMSITELNYNKNVQVGCLCVSGTGSYERAWAGWSAPCHAASNQFHSSWKEMVIARVSDCRKARLLVKKQNKKTVQESCFLQLTDWTAELKINMQGRGTLCAHSVHASVNSFPAFPAINIKGIRSVTYVTGVSYGCNQEVNQINVDDTSLNTPAAGWPSTLCPCDKKATNQSNFYLKKKALSI